MALLCLPGLAVLPYAAAQSAEPVLPAVPSAAPVMPVWLIDSDASSVRIVVRKAGILSLFGHDHVVSTTEISGLVLMPRRCNDIRANFMASLETLEVDRQDYREEFGFDKVLPDSAKRGTRKNMLENVLETGKWPMIAIQAAGGGDCDAMVFKTRINLHGVSQELDVPATVHTTEDELSATGSFTFLQSGFGIKPFSVAAGSLRIADEIEVHFDLHARKRAVHPEPQAHSPEADNE